MIPITLNDSRIKNLVSICFLQIGKMLGTILLLSVFLSACQSGQNNTQTQVITENNTPDIQPPKPSPSTSFTLPYRLNPSNLPENEKAPIVFALHGFKSNMDDLFGLKDYIDPRFTFVSVQAPHSAGENQYKWYDLVFSNKGDVSSNTTEAAESVQILSSFIDAAVAQLKADVDQVYLLGFSQGAMMSLYLALSEPQKIAGVAVLSGKMIEGLESHISQNRDDLSNLSVLVTHGKNDNVISIEQAREMNQMLEKLPVRLSYNEYNMGHQISEQCLKDISKWFENSINR
ncbi:MAG: alpha/beta fold hydrolase [Chitinophagales bacterium]